MQTRVEKWKTHRQKIETNFLLSESIINSNDDLKKMLKELVKFFPNIADKLQTQDTNLETTTTFNEINEQFQEYQILEVELLLQELKKITIANKKNLSYINKINFSSHELDGLINKLK